MFVQAPLEAEKQKDNRPSVQVGNMKQVLPIRAPGLSVLLPNGYRVNSWRMTVVPQLS